MYFWDKLPLMLILAGLIPAFSLPIVARWKRDFCAPYAIAISVATFTISCYLFIHALRNGPWHHYAGGWEPPWGIEIAIEPLSGLMIVLITGLIVLISLYSYGSLRKEMNPEARGWYYVEFILCLTAMLGLVVTRDLFNTYVFIEVVGISAVALVISKGERLALEAGLKYLILATLASGFLMFGIGFTYMTTGHLNLALPGRYWRRMPPATPTYAAMSFCGWLRIKSAFSRICGCPTLTHRRPRLQRGSFQPGCKYILWPSLKSFSWSSRRFLPGKFHSLPGFNFGFCGDDWRFPVCFRAAGFKTPSCLFHSGADWLYLPGIGLGSPWPLSPPSCTW